MKLAYIYVVLCTLGLLLPYALFMPWLLQHGLDVSRLTSEIAASPVAAFGWLDVLISALALFVFILSERQKQKVKLYWLPILATLLVGVSLGLPLYLFLRELSVDQQMSR